MNTRKIILGEKRSKTGISVLAAKYTVGHDFPNLMTGKSENLVVLITAMLMSFKSISLDA